MSAIVTRDPAASALRLFFPQPHHPSPDQQQDSDETFLSSHDDGTVVTAMTMVASGQSRARTLVQATSLLLLHQPSLPATLAPSSSSLSSSLVLSQQQQREDVAEEGAGALCTLLAALRINATTFTINNENTTNGHLLALSLLVSGGVVEVLTRLLQQAMMDQPTALLDKASSRVGGREKAPLVVARCVRAIAILTQNTHKHNHNVNHQDARWLRAITEESVSRCVSTTTVNTTSTAFSSKQKSSAGGLLKVLCVVILRYSHCTHMITGHDDDDDGNEGEQEPEQEEGHRLYLLDNVEAGEEGRRAVAMWGLAALLDILEGTRRDLALALVLESRGHSKLRCPTVSLSGGGVSGGGEDLVSVRARALAALSVRGKLLQGGVADSLAAVLRDHINAVVRFENAAAAAGDGDDNGVKSKRDHHHLRPSTAASAMAARAMRLLLTLTLHSTPSTADDGDGENDDDRNDDSSAKVFGSSSLGSSYFHDLGGHRARRTKWIDLDSNGSSSSSTVVGGTLAAHTSLRKVI